jgi:CRP/FNR family nitrogen fixation transcriptional regulator
MKARAHSIDFNHPPNCQRVPGDRPGAARSLDSVAVIMSWHRGQEIYTQGDPAEFWYRIRSGAARCYAMRPDGRRRIVDLLLPGDHFGFAAGDEHEFTVEAVAEGTSAARYPRWRLEALADSDPRLARDIRSMAFQALLRTQMQLLTIGRVTALQKVSSFLIDFASRLPEKSENSIVLPVSRYDIADYLALSVETVSRSLSDLKQRGIIGMRGSRHVRIIDRAALDEVERRAPAGW